MGREIKIASGVFFIGLGLYIISQFSNNSSSVIGGLFCISIGIGIIAHK
jgi:hypothetical protein